MRPHYSPVTLPATEPVSLEQVTDHVRVDSADDQEYITGLIPVCREYIESITGRVCVSSGWRVVADSWRALFGTWDDYGMVFPLFRAPLISVESISYYPAGSDTLTVLVAGADFRAITTTEPGLIQMLGSLPCVENRPDAIIIEFTAGYADADYTPPMLKHAIKTMVGHLYEHRVPVAFAASSQIPFSLSTFIENQKIGGWVG